MSARRSFNSFRENYGYQEISYARAFLSTTFRNRASLCEGREHFSLTAYRAILQEGKREKKIPT